MAISGFSGRITEAAYSKFIIPAPAITAVPGLRNSV